MRQVKFLLFVGFSIFYTQHLAISSQVLEAVPGEFIVRKKTLRTTDLSSSGFEVKKLISPSERVFLVKRSLLSGLSVSSSGDQGMVQNIQTLPEVQSVEPNYIVRTQFGSKPPAPAPQPTPAPQPSPAPQPTPPTPQPSPTPPPTSGNVTPNDTNFKLQWGLNNDGSQGVAAQPGKKGADIRAPQAWSMGTGSRNIVVAIVDTGIDYNHPDLRGNLWVKPKDSAGEADTYGFNAIDGTLNPLDDNGHGTHVAGIIGASGNNAAGVAGVNWTVSMMGIKFLSSQGSGTTADAITGIYWAVDHGAHVLNNSWGGPGFTQALDDAIAYANSKGVVFVAAAGNDRGQNLDQKPTYPASYKQPNMVVVAATTNKDQLASFSNIGANTVHIAAPGEDIYSTYLKGTYKKLSGTSMATPFVTGAIALLLSREPNLSVAEIKERLMTSSDKLSSLRSKIIKGGGRLNVLNLLSNTVVPDPFTAPEELWSEPQSRTVESEHPYRASQTKQWVVEQSGARMIRIHFSRLQTKSSTDVIRIIESSSGEVVQSFSGFFPQAFWSTPVMGSKLIIELQSGPNGSEPSFGYGFLVDAISVVK